MKTKVDKYQQIADKMLFLMQQDLKPWDKSWYSNPYRNAVTGHEYSGVNPLLCGLDCLINDWEDTRFITFKQCQEKNWKIKKGSKATIIRWGGSYETQITDESTGETKTETRGCRKFFNVFNITCIDDSESEYKIEPFSNTLPAHQEPKIDEIENFIEKQNIKTSFGNPRAFYSLDLDAISLPSFEHFKDAISYYCTHLHELGHSTGHPNRCNRDMSGHFGSQKYAFEELVAELTSVFICNNFNLEYDDSHHASYLKSWMSIIKEDNKAFFKAASLAEKAVRYMKNNLNETGNSNSTTSGTKQIEPATVSS